MPTSPLLDDDFNKNGGSDSEAAQSILDKEKKQAKLHIRHGRIVFFILAGISGLLLLGATFGRGEGANDPVGKAFYDSLSVVFGLLAAIFIALGSLAMRWPVPVFGIGIVVFLYYYVRFAAKMPLFIHIVPMIFLFFLFRGLLNGLKSQSLEKK